MNDTLFSIGRIVLGPWQQRRSQGGLWGLAVIAALCTLLAAVVGVVSGGTTQAWRVVAVAIAGMWCLGGWAMLVLNVFPQNHPTFARLVPHHAARLRGALLSAWAVLLLFAAAASAACGWPVLAWTTGVAATLVAVAAALRWPLLWMLGCFAPFVGQALAASAWAHDALAVAATAWDAWRGAIACAVAIGGAAFLASLVRRGDARHAASYRTRGNNDLRFHLRAAGMVPLTPADGAAGLVSRAGGWAYHAWMRRVLARPGSAPMVRALLALGPSAHWTTRVTGGLVTFGICLFFVVLFRFTPLAPFLAGALGGLSVGAVAGIIVPTMQSRAKLYQTRREQSLVALLPGVPRQGRLNRWLSGRLTFEFLASWLAALLLATLLDVVATALADPQARANVGDGRAMMQAALIPLIAFHWGSWARMAAPTALNALWPYLAGMLLVAVTWGVHHASGLGYVEIGAAYALLAMAWFAVRWRRMASEPSAFPIGRVA